MKGYGYKVWSEDRCRGIAKGKDIIGSVRKILGINQDRVLRMYERDDGDAVVFEEDSFVCDLKRFDLIPLKGGR